MHFPKDRDFEQRSNFVNAADARKSNAFEFLPNLSLFIISVNSSEMVLCYHSPENREFQEGVRLHICLRRGASRVVNLLMAVLEWALHGVACQYIALQRCVCAPCSSSTYPLVG